MVKPNVRWLGREGYVSKAVAACLCFHIIAYARHYCVRAGHCGIEVLRALFDRSFKIIPNIAKLLGLLFSLLMLRLREVKTILINGMSLNEHQPDY